MSDGLTDMYREMDELLAKKVVPVYDMVNSPPHYTKHKWEVIEILEEFFPNDPLLFNVGKYLLRSPYKGNAVQDLEKAVWYLQRKINKLKEDQNA